MAIDRLMATEDWERLVGRQVRRSRIGQNVDQVSLARRANISVGALKNLEAGHGSTLRTLVRTVRALGREDWLESFDPEPEVSPLALARAAEGIKAPQRASRRRV